MAISTLTLYRDFIEDNRLSMEVYADNLVRSLNLIAGDSINVNHYRPLIPEWMVKYKVSHAIKIRFARYFSYPITARKNQGAINHIIDQSYAHLLNVIDSTRSVITVHDLIPLLAWKGKIPGMSYPHYPFLFKFAIASLHKAHTIIAVSHSTKKDLVTYCGLKDSNIIVIHNGIDSGFRSFPKKEKVALRRSFGFPEDGAHLVLITGSQNYKNHVTSLRVIDRLQHATKNPVQLVWLGSEEDGYKKSLEGVNLKNRVIRLNQLSLKRLVELYNSVDCLLFPSWYEGFGLPPLEAMACGTPVVASTAASLPEIVGDASLTAEPGDADGLTKAVKLILENEALRNNYIKRGYKNASHFTWERCASEVFTVYKKIIDATI